MAKKQKAESKAKGFFGNWIVKNLLMAVAFFLGLLLAVSLLLNIVTRHNKTVLTPDFTNMTVAEAEAAAERGHVQVKVVDSVFVRRLGAGVVFRQTPKAGAEVKKGRSIFLTINSIVPKKTAMPNLVGYSFLEAMAELSNHGLNLERISYTSDMATNNVLRQLYRGREIKPGAQIVSGSDIELVLGLSRENSKTTVPKVIGMKYIRAVDAIHERYLNVGRVHFDPEIRTYRDSVNAFVYKQDAAGSAKTLGSSVNLHLTLDESKLPQK
jgi:beta-lactam-binding protein with PASTA domain